jgi:ribosomal protein S12 methylthiotransferase
MHLTNSSFKKIDICCSSEDRAIKVAAISLGCAKNRIDTEEILGLLSLKGYLLTDDFHTADIVFVNTCGFIDKAQQESINTLLEVVASKKERAKIVIAAGCLVEVYGSKLLATIPEIEGVIGVHSYTYLDRFIALIRSGKRVFIKKTPRANFCSLAPRVLTTPAHSANVKIAEGCNNRCHYCLIPKIRGPYRSRPPDEIITEINNLLIAGTREINLIAQDTTAYGIDCENYPDLTNLIKNILSIPKKFWLRIMYTYPSRVNEELIETVASDQRVCNYLDIPIQHSNDIILQSMDRHYNRHLIIDLVAKARKRIPDLALRTTCMVGYPGEGRMQFIDLLNFIKISPFEHLGAFTYSCQKGTVAGNSANQVPRRVAKKRLSELMNQQQQISARLNQKFVGKWLTVLVEKTLLCSNNWYYGRTQYQAPEVDGGVYFKSAIALNPGDWVTVRIDASSPYNLLAVRSKPLSELPF